MNKARPYRSHRIPACSRCRARRSKCTITSVGKACLGCQQHGARCSADSSREKVHFEDADTPDTGATPSEVSRTANLHVVPPMVARDTRALENLLPTSDVETIGIESKRPQRPQPVYRVPIPPHRPSPERCECLRDLSLQLVHQVEPAIEHITFLYLKHLQPCLPMLDEPSLRSRIRRRDPPARAFLVSFLAYVSFYWTLSPDLQRYTRPNQDFAWQVVVLDHNINAGTGIIDSIVGAVLNVAGRPSKGTIHNMANVGQIIALSNSIGLNHDSSEWQISETEKKIRWKLWWAVLVLDRWFNFAQGTPPLIHAAHHDVPLPNQLLLRDQIEMTERKVQALDCYIALCQLTEIVGDILPLIYYVRSGTTKTDHSRLSLFKDRLDLWVKNLPDEILILNFENRSAIHGLVNLQLSYLSTKMLLLRLELHQRSQSGQPHDESLLQNCQRIAERIVDFVVSLQPDELAAFWLPFNAQHITSAMTLLLRCALQRESHVNRGACIRRADELIKTLRNYRDNLGWDMADIALYQSEPLLKRIEEALPILHRERHSRHDRETSFRTPERRTVAQYEDQDNVDYYQYDPLGQQELEDLFPGIFASFNDSGSFDPVST